MDRVIKALIVGDEMIGRRVLREELELLPQVLVVAEAEGGKEALQKIIDEKPDLLFIDVQMRVMGGLEVVQSLSGSPPPLIVFIGALPEQAIEAFELGAFDFLLKPVSAARLQKSLERVKKLKKSLDNEQSMARIVRPSDKSMPIRRKLVGRAGREYHIVDTNEILAIQAEGDVVWILTSEHRLQADQTLRALEENVLPQCFLRVHRNAIVNINHVQKLKSLSSQRWVLTLSNDLELIVSKRNAHNIRDVLERKRLG